MSDYHIPRGQIATLDRVEGKLIIGNNATLQAANGKNVVVTEGVYLQGKAYVNCDLECDSLESEVFLSRESTMSDWARVELTGRYPGKLEVRGNLTVHKRLNVSHSVDVSGTINAQDIDVGGKIEATSLICTRMRVGGKVEIDEIFEAQSVDVGGKVEADGTVKLGNLNVGGEVEVGGGSITGNIRVGGRFSANKPLEFGDLQVGGKGELPANCKGHRISTFGKLTVAGPLKCDIIEAGGYIEIDGNCEAEKVEVGGKVEVRGMLTVADKLEGFGATEIQGNFSAQHMRVSGKFEANRIEVKEDADVSGRVETKQGFKAKTLLIRVGSRCDGVLIADYAEIGKSADLSWGSWGVNWAQKWAVAGAMARVGDVYAGEVVLGPMSRADRIFADKVSLEQNSAAQQVTYTTEFETGFGSAVAEPPKKVTELPKPPF